MDYRTNSLVVLYATKPLLLQLHEWQEARGGVALLLLPPKGPPHLIHEAVDRAVAAVVDATNHPDEAKAVLQDGLEQERGKFVVYSGVQNHPLETLVRTRGDIFWLGPLEQAELEETFRAIWPVGGTAKS